MNLENFRDSNQGLEDIFASVELPGLSEEEDWVNIQLNSNENLEKDIAATAGDGEIIDGSQTDTKKRTISCVSSDSEETSSLGNYGGASSSLFDNASMIGLTDLEKDAIMEEFEALKTNSSVKPHKLNEIREIIQSSDDPKDMIIKLLRQFITQKRTKKNPDGKDEVIKGYTCRICNVAAKGHVCPYCEVCSTSDDKHEKGGNHICFNCTNCYYKAKKVKKLKQVKIVSCKCATEAVGKTEEV